MLAAGYLSLRLYTEIPIPSPVSFLSWLLGGDKRNRRLAAWGKSVPLSDTQRLAMQRIWEAVKEKRAPEGKPLDALSSEDREYVLKVCGASFRPIEFGNADVLRLSSYRDFEELGFSEEEAAVAVGMMFNWVGRDAPE